MFQEKLSPISGLRLTAVLLTTLFAGCSMNPFSGDAEPRRAPAMAQASAPAPAATNRPAPEPYQPALVRVSEPVPLASGAPNEYVVKPGDTLWDIAATFLRDPWFWPEIWYVNPDIVNPHLIYPGDVLGLVYIDGQPRITNVRASTYRLSPQARVSPISESINSIPYESISAFLSSGMVLAKDEVDDLPYMIASRGDHMIAAAGNDIYVRGAAGDEPGTRYSVVHIGDPLVDPDDNRVIGYQGIWVGEGTVRRRGDPATFRLNDTSQEAKEGDRLVPEVVDIALNFMPKAPRTAVDGRIISVEGGVTQIGQYQVVVINRGGRDGLGVGDVLTVFQAGRKVRDRIGGGRVKLPDEEAATVMIFKLYDDISYGLVMEATQAVHIHDAVRNPT